MTARILIVDSVPTNRIVLRVKLASAFYEVTQAATGKAALTGLRRSRPDLVIASAALQDMTGQEFCAELRRHAVGQNLPVILIHNDANPSERLASLAAGADDVLPRPVDDLVMLARLRSLLRARDAETELQLREDTRRALGMAEEPGLFEAPSQIALIPAGRDLAATRKLLEPLRARLSDQITLLSADTALRKGRMRPDVVVLVESEEDGGEGLALLPQLRSNNATRHAALIYVAHPHQRREAASALDMGANDLLASGPDVEELALRLRKQAARKRTADRLRANMRDGLRAAVIDPLTGLYNRRYALPYIARMAERTEGQGRPYALLLADLDHFKRVNDDHGHAAGDAVLRELADRLRDNLRAADLLSRFGGEEFLIAMPDTGRDAAHATAERICRIMSDNPVTLPNGETLCVTLSVGVAIGRPRDGIKPADLIEKADRALYAAKDNGRNTVVMADRIAHLKMKHPGSIPAPRSNPSEQRREASGGATG